MTVYRVNMELAHLIWELPAMRPVLERKDGLRDSYTGEELRRMLFSKEINYLIDKGALIGPHVSKEEIRKTGLHDAVTEKRRLLADNVIPLLNGSPATPQRVYMLLRSPENEELRRTIYPKGMSLDQLKRDLRAIGQLADF